ncbi:hypothetical protein J5J83_10485 [Azoarcus sp. L1K30]|uniref:hypothetical protein n=1 Tax=Azoarcus sp. L1K30 TaxID=2820277 RepID=UPI001B835B6F|nr:hypothetical protein [Azoarcus sp. L1K30]MBR0566541.1 hypothetical protein [Azoarcus sp. L1K30]
MNVEHTLASTRDRIEAAATDILTLIEGLTADEFTRSRLTRKTTLARLRDIADAAAALSAEGCAAMPEVDWAGWVSLGSAIDSGGIAPAREWKAASEDAGTLLQWMRVYGQGDR